MSPAVPPVLAPPAPSPMRIVGPLPPPSVPLPRLIVPVPVTLDRMTALVPPAALLVEVNAMPEAPTATPLMSSATPVPELIVLPAPVAVTVPPPVAENAVVLLALVFNVRAPAKLIAAPVLLVSAMPSLAPVEEMA